MDPATIALVAQVGSTAFGAVSASQTAAAEKEQARINSFIGRTRGLQSDTVARQGMENELGSLRAAIGANGEAPSVGTLEVVNELRRTRNRERSIDAGNSRAASADFNRQARNAAVSQKGAIIGGLIKAGPSIFDIGQLQKKKRTP